MSHGTPIVFVVDDDVSVRESLESLIRFEGWRSEALNPPTNSSRSHTLRGAPSCLLLDLTLPGLNGLELQERIAADRSDMRIIFISGYGDVPETVRAVKTGAVHFLTKPLNDDDLLSAIRQAIDPRSRSTLAQQSEMRQLRQCLMSAHSTRTRSPGPGGFRPVEQTNRCRIGHQRDHRESPSRQSHGKDAGRIFCRFGENDRRTAHGDRSRLSTQSLTGSIGRFCEKRLGGVRKDRPCQNRHGDSNGRKTSELQRRAPARVEDGRAWMSGSGNFESQETASRA